MPTLVANGLTQKQFDHLRVLGPNSGVMVDPTHAKSHSSVARALDTSRSSKWRKMLSRWDLYTQHKTQKIKRRVRKGVPDQDRRSVWNTLANIGSFLSEYPGLYAKLVAASPAAMVEREDKMGEGDGSRFSRHTATGALLTTAQLDVEQDLYRTFPEHAAFERGTPKGRRTIGALRRVLYAYAAFDPELGYCQSLNFLAGTFLLYVPEEECFWHLVSLMQRSDSPLRGLFLRGMAEMQQIQRCLDSLVEIHLPKLSSHMKVR